MARYDVFLASTLADREKAELIVRRLRALKFKVRYDKKREHTTPTPKDYRDADNSQSTLILWSKAEACATDSPDSDWVHAIAHHARSKTDVLVQASLDSAVPDEPFNNDQRFDLSGMGPRKLVEGYYQLVEDLGARDGRTDLRDWLALKASDKDGKEIWKENHPNDPLALVGKAKEAPKPAAPAPKPEASLGGTGIYGLSQLCGQSGSTGLKSKSVPARSARNHHAKRRRRSHYRHVAAQRRLAVGHCRDRTHQRRRDAAGGTMPSRTDSSVSARSTGSTAARAGPDHRRYRMIETLDLFRIVLRGGRQAHDLGLIALIIPI